MKRLIILTISLLVTSLTITLSPLNAQSPPVPPAPAQVTAQSKDLIPQKTDKGVLFQCSAPGATAVYLAGDFNNWASNSNGVITDPAAKMTGPDSKGLWQMTVKLAPGDHSFKFCVNGAAELWLTPDWAIDRDADGNAVIHVTADGSPLLHSTAKTNAVPTLHDISAAATAFYPYYPYSLMSAAFGTLCFYVFVSGIIFIPIIIGARQARFTHETIRLMVEKGQPVPPELFRDPKLTRPRNDLRRGVTLIAFGIGFSAFLVSLHSTWWAIGFIFILMGVGYLIVWKMEPRPNDNGKPS